MEYPPHWHEGVYISAVISGTNQLDVRGRSLHTPQGTLGVVAAGEVHANHKTRCSFRVMFISATLLRSAVEQCLERALPEPHVRSGVIADPQAATWFLDAHRSLQNPSSELERDVSLSGFLQHFVARHTAASLTMTKERREDLGVLRAKRFLDDCYTEAVSLEELARLARLSPFHLNRCFTRSVGLPPHAYQLQLRLTHAKASLRAGRSAAEAASMAGFFDQSHFAHHFRRCERMTPGQYQRLRKNVQDNRTHTAYFCGS